MMKEGRGRSSDGGSMMVNTHYNDWYFELNALEKQHHLDSFYRSCQP